MMLLMLMLMMMLMMMMSACEWHPRPPTSTLLLKHKARKTTAEMKLRRKIRSCED